MKKIFKFEAKDGRVFDTEEECQDHELVIKKQELIKQVGEQVGKSFETNMRTGRAESLLIGILNEPQLFISLIQPLLKTPARKKDSNESTKNFWELMNSSPEPLSFSGMAEKGQLSWNFCKRIVAENADKFNITSIYIAGKEVFKYSLKK